MTDRDRLLDDQVRQADPDRWLSSRFVTDARARADLIVLYAFEAELMAIPTRVTQPLLAEMRYAWWSEQLDGVWAGLARKGHPVLEALTEAVARHGLDRAPFEALIDAHIGRVQDRPHDLDAFYVGPMQVAARILAGAGLEERVSEAGRVWGQVQTGRTSDARQNLAAANVGLQGLPVAAFPAVAHATLARGGNGIGIRRLRLTWACAWGRV